jgi:hypothetical protein
MLHFDSHYLQMSLHLSTSARIPFSWTRLIANEYAIQTVLSRGNIAILWGSVQMQHMKKAVIHRPLLIDSQRPLCVELNYV